MKTLKIFAVMVAVLLAAGCATTGYDNTVTGAVGGGLLGGGISKAIGGSASKGAVTGALLGAGIGVFADHQQRKDDERAEKIGGLIYNKTGGGNDSGAAQATATAESNLAFAENQRRKCEAKYAVYTKNGVRVPHDCRIEFNRALADAEYTSEVNSPEVFHATMSGGYNYGYGYHRYSGYWNYWNSGVGAAQYNRDPYGYVYGGRYGYRYGR